MRQMRHLYHDAIGLVVLIGDCLRRLVGRRRPEGLDRLFDTCEGTTSLVYTFEEVADSPKLVTNRLVNAPE
jgi:hypothetical protein